jgi:myo-inositol-1(or 4)-monophosphatase
VTFKGATDLVTETDKVGSCVRDGQVADIRENLDDLQSLQASEAAILACIRSAFPTHAFLGEEGGVDGPSDSEYLW